MSKPKPTKRPAVPKFASEAEERRFWESHDVTGYFDWTRAVQPRFPELKPSTASISIRLPVGMLDELKALANARDVPYQSLMKVFLADRLVRERQVRPRRGAR
jgi:predicted DNA binding CopG/RHH family protein